MKSQIASIISPRALGVYIEKDAVHACQVISTPLGEVELDRNSMEVGVDGPVATAARLIKEVVGRHTERIPLAVSLASDVSFFTTRPMQANSKDVSPRSLLREALRSPDASVEQMAVGVATFKPEQRNLASIFACDERLIQSLAQAAERAKLRLVKVEPVAKALLRFGEGDKLIRRAKVVLHLFLDEQRVLAVLTAKGRPIAQRRASLPLGDEATAIINLARSIATISRTCGVDGSPDLVLIHGRSELPQLLDMQWLHQQMGARIEWLKGPTLDGCEIALSVARGCLDDQDEGLDLAAAYRQTPSLREIFPFRELALQLMLVAAMAWFLIIRLADVQHSADRASIQNSQNATAAADVQQLEKSKKELEQRITSGEKFLKDRVVWTRCLRQVTRCLPDNVQLTSVQGVSQLTQGKKGRSKDDRKLILTGAVTLTPGGVVPLEIDRLLNALRSDEAITKEFPLIELAELKQFQNAKKEAQAIFTVVCLPKTGGKKS